MPHRLVNDDFLPRLRQDFTHRLKVKAGPGDLRRLDILLKHGTKCSGITLGLIESLSIVAISSNYKDVISFTVLIAIMIIMPNGMLGRTGRQGG